MQQTGLDEILPKEGRREFWTRLRQELKRTVPSLVRPTWLVGVLTLIAISLAGAVTYLGCLAMGSNLGIAMGLATLIAAGACLVVATAPMATRVGHRFQTFRELSQYVLARNHAALATELASWNAGDMWEVLRVIVSE